MRVNFFDGSIADPFQTSSLIPDPRVNYFKNQEGKIL